MSDTRRAAKAFEDFTGRKPSKTRRDQLQHYDAAGWQMGPVVGIAYEAIRDGQRSQYFHEFAKAARPNLVARDDGKQLFITGGKYTVTERGIEDMPELFVVNPSSRSRAAAKRKPMAAAKRNSKGRFVKAGSARPKAKTRQVAVFNSNPAPARKKRRAPATRAAAAPKRRRFRRNPSGLPTFKGLGQLVMPAAGVGAGAVGAELLMGYLPIPAAWKSGVMRHVTKGVVGLAAGWGLAHFLKQKKLGFYVMAGAVVIATHDAIKEFVANRMHDVAFGQYVSPLRSQFGGARGMGYVSPAGLIGPGLGQYIDNAPMGFNGMSQAYDSPGGETTFIA